MAVEEARVAASEAPGAGRWATAAVMARVAASWDVEQWVMAVLMATKEAEGQLAAEKGNGEALGTVHLPL